MVPENHLSSCRVLCIIQNRDEGEFEKLKEGLQVPKEHARNVADGDLLLAEPRDIPGPHHHSNAQPYPCNCARVRFIA